jgi:hypothetical protein
VPGSEPRGGRWLVVVPRSDLELYESLRRALKENAPFDVILERRQGERRRAGQAQGLDRRRSDRRQRAPAGAVYLSGKPPGDAVGPPSSASGVVTAHAAVVDTACPACWVPLSFELPRFPKPPARLEAEVVHVGGPRASQHFAEIQAFTVSGRLLLVQRVQAVRSAGAV